MQSVILNYKTYKKQLLPMFHVHLLFGRKITGGILAMLDSGATYSIFSAERAVKDLEIDYKEGKKIILDTVKGKKNFTGYLNKVNMAFCNDNSLTTDVLFSDDWKYSYGLLGQIGIFDKFFVSFDKKKLKFCLHPNKDVACTDLS